MKHYTNYDFTVSRTLENKHVDSMKVSYNTNYDTEVSYKNFLNIEDMQNLSVSDLFALKNKSLEQICIEIGVPKSGKKSKKVHNIMTGLSELLDKVTWNTNINYDSNTDDCLKYIFENGLHEIVTYTQVRKMAFGGTPVFNDSGEIEKFRPYTCKQGCELLMYNNQDCLWDDVRQNVALAILENKDEFSVVNGYVKMTPAGFRIVRKYISRVFGAIRKNSNQTEEELFAIDYKEVENPDTGKKDKQEVIVKCGKKSDSSYIKALSHGINDDLLTTNNFVKSYFEWLHKESAYKKYADNMQTVFSGKVAGMTNQQIMKNYGISRRIFDKCYSLLKVSYADFGNICHVVKNESSNRFYGCTYMDNDSSITGSYSYKYSTGNNNGVNYSISSDRIEEMKKDRESADFGKFRQWYNDTMRYLDGVMEDGEKHVYTTKSGKKFTFVNGKEVSA